MDDVIEELPGFTKLGVLSRVDGQSLWVQADPFPRYAALYAFVVGRQRRYIGAATDLARRMAGYRRRQVAELLTRPVHHEIRRTLDDGGEVSLFVREIAPRRIDHNGLPLTYFWELKPDLSKNTILPGIAEIEIRGCLLTMQTLQQA